MNVARSPDELVIVTSDPLRSACRRLESFDAVDVELRVFVVPVAVPFVALVLVVVVLTLLLLPTILLSPVITVPPVRKISVSLFAVALALLVLVLLEVALGAGLVVGLGVAAVVAGWLPVLFAGAVVGAGAAVPVAVGVVPGAGATVPLEALPDPATVAALIVVVPDALIAPDPLLVALTVVDPDALVTALCPMAWELPSTVPSRAALTAVAIVLLGRWFFIVMRFLHKMNEDDGTGRLRAQKACASIDAPPPGFPQGAYPAK